MYVERPVFPVAVIQDDNQSILILAAAERPVFTKLDVEWQIFERGECPENKHLDNGSSAVINYTICGYYIMMHQYYFVNVV